MAKKPWFYGKNILLTGASTGIGFNLARLLCLNGARVIGVSRSEEKLRRAKELIDGELGETKGSFSYFQFDVTGDFAALKNALDENGISVDILINNAGAIFPFKKFKDQKVDDARRLFEVNFFSQLKAYETFIGDITKNKGAIINIASSSALCPVVGEAVYSASKAAVKGFTESICEEHKDIYVAAVYPGFTKTELFGDQKWGKLVDKISMPATKMAKKIFNGIKKKKRRMVIGGDAHLMSGFYRLMPNTTMRIMTKVLKGSKDEMFNDIFKD